MIRHECALDLLPGHKFIPCEQFVLEFEHQNEHDQYATGKRKVGNLNAVLIDRYRRSTEENQDESEHQQHAPQGSEPHQHAFE